MIEPPNPPDEQRRLDALQQYEVLDTEPEQDFDDLTRLASLLCGTPICLVSLVDANRQWFKSRVGLEATETPRNIAFCSHAILDSEKVLVVPDATKDERFHDNPLVTEDPNVRFYAGAPLVTPEGHGLGTLCVIDHEPRNLDENQVLALRVLARQVVSQLELRKQCRDLTAARSAAEAATEAKSEFLSNMSHEIRTPMNALLGMAELLEGTSLTEEQSEYVRVFRRAGRSLLELINDILDLSKVEAGRLTLHEEPIRLRRFLESTLEVLAVSAHQKNLTLTLHLGEGIPEAVVGDAARIRQVLINLIGNAIKFTEKGGVELRVERESNSDSLELSVTDTGIGISTEAQQRLFQPFTQVDASAGRRYGGTGLGLHLSRRLVGLMGGTLTLKSEEGVGSTFCCRLDLPPHADSPEDSPAASRWRGVRVLLADDSEAERTMIRGLLDGLGCVTTEASSGQDALARHTEAVAAGSSFDVILMSARMPGPVPGWELASSEGWAERTVIMLAANHRRSDITQCQKLGLAGRLTKPVQLESLRDALDRVLGSAAEVGARTAPPAVEPSPAGPPLRILLTDDSKDNRFLIQQYLRSGSHEIDAAETGEEALEKFCNGHYDVVLMDIQLPGMDGYAATRAIRGWETKNGRERTPVLALTADAMTEHRERALQAGCDEHVPKPISRSALLEALQRHVRQPDPDEDLDEDPIAALRPGYLEGRRAALPTLREAVQDADLKTLERLGHNMKGSGTSYGFPEITDIGDRLESAAKAGDLDAAFVAVEDLSHFLGAGNPNILSGVRS